MHADLAPGGTRDETSSANVSDNVGDNVSEAATVSKLAAGAGVRAGTVSEADAPPFISIRHLSKSYQRGEQLVPVLLDIHLDVRSGEFVALMGPSGSGKSTLLNLIAGIDKPTHGTIEIAGVDIATLGEGELADWRAANVGFVFQFYNLMPVLTAAENVELPLLLANLSGRERRARAAAALAAVGLTDRASHYPNELSGGQQQRVAIARALVTEPALIVADEPTGDLDRATGAEVLALLRALVAERGKTIVMVTHDPKAAASAMRLVHLEKGVLVDEPDAPDAPETPDAAGRAGAAGAAH